MDLPNHPAKRTWQQSSWDLSNERWAQKKSRLSCQVCRFLIVSSIPSQTEPQNCPCFFVKRIGDQKSGSIEGCNFHFHGCQPHLSCWPTCFSPKPRSSRHPWRLKLSIATQHRFFQFMFFCADMFCGLFCHHFFAICFGVCNLLCFQHLQVFTLVHLLTPVTEPEVSYGSWHGQ